MKVYKGTDKNIKCRGYQFTPGVEAVEDGAKLCSKGFHACEAPLDVLGYYPPGLGSRYFEAELEDVSPERESEDSKVCGKRITLGAEIGIPGLAKAHIEWVKSNITKAIERGDKDSVAVGDKESAAAGASGSAAAGDYGSAVSRGSAESGKDGLSVARGTYAKVKGGLGALLVCALEREDSYKITGWKAAIVDGETIKPDTWYTLKNGEFVEVADDE